MKISFLILNYNSYELTLKLINEIKNYKLIDYIIVVDNNSSNIEKEKLNNLVDDKIIKIFNNENYGYAYGNNIGLKYANEQLKSDFVIVANPDISVEEDTLKECIKVIKKNNNCAVSAPRIKNINCYGNVAWKLATYKNEIFSLFYITNKFLNKSLQYADNEIEGDIEIVDVLPGSLLIMNMKLIEEVGYFDENTFLYCEEKILSQKLKSKGYINILVNDYTYIHEHGVIIKKEFKSKLKQYKILNESKKYYIAQYLKCNNIQIAIFSILSKISIIEKYLIEKILKWL